MQIAVTRQDNQRFVYSKNPGRDVLLTLLLPIHIDQQSAI